MFDRLEELVNRYEELGIRLNEPSIIGDQGLWQKIMKEHAGLMPLVETYQRYKAVKQNEEEARMLLEEEKEEELRQLAKEELAQAKEELAELETRLKVLLLPHKDNLFKAPQSVFIQAGQLCLPSPALRIPSVHPVQL